MPNKFRWLLLTGVIAGGFYLMSGHMKNGDKRVLNVDFAVAWKTPEGQS